MCISNQLKPSFIRPRMNRSESLYVPPQISESLIEKSVVNHAHKDKFNHSMHLKDRGMMRNMVAAGMIDQARNLIKENLPEIYEANIKIRANFDALEFLSLIEA